MRETGALRWFACGQSTLSSMDLFRRRPRNRYRKLVAQCLVWHPYGQRSMVAAECCSTRPQVVEEMTSELRKRGISDRQVAVRRSSHFGGHRFAGVLIIYPQGDW